MPPPTPSVASTDSPCAVRSLHLSGADPARQPLGPRHVGGMTAPRLPRTFRTRPLRAACPPAQRDALEAFDDALSERPDDLSGGLSRPGWPWPDRRTPAVPLP